MRSNEPVLQIENLTVAYRQNGTWLEAVRDVSLSVHPGETYGLVGESGSGKTTLALAVMRYLGDNGTIRSGQVFLSGRDLLALSMAEMRQVWGKQIALVPQNPASALNPAMRAGEQLAESLRHHLGLDRAVANSLAIEWFERVGLADPARVAGSYPHQISGGMQQRVLIALALSTDPRLLILDEPTTNLDVTTQAVILERVRELILGQNTAVLYVTHNLGVVAQVCDRVAVLYAGELVEEASTADLFARPLHPYTAGLIDSVPRLGESKGLVRLQSIQGSIPPMGDLPTGCVFRTRCPLAVEICETHPPLFSTGAFQKSRCHRWEEIRSGAADPRQGDQPGPLGPKSIRRSAASPAGPPEGSPAKKRVNLRIESLDVHFPIRRPLIDVIRKSPPKMVRAVNRVDLEISPGETLGLVGESGSGKTTLARAVMGLVPRTGGEIELLSAPLPEHLSQRDLATLRRLQMVFQNPDQAFNPYITIGEALGRALIRLLGIERSQVQSRVARLLEAVRLNAEYASRYPGQLSGGELQRVAIARAFAANPELVICDEPVSALDVSVQAAILNLIHDLQHQHGNSLLFISHDLAVVGYLADVIAVVYLGHLMEAAPATELFEPPHHPYTEALLSAIPDIDPSRRGKPIHLAGDIPRPTDIQTGCPFHTRCPRFLGKICVEETPPWQTVPGTKKRIFCHIPVSELAGMQSHAGRRRAS